MEYTVGHRKFSICKQKVKKSDICLPRHAITGVCGKVLCKNLEAWMQE